MGGQPRENGLTAAVSTLPTGPNRQNGKVCPHQFSKSNCKLGALESQRMGMRKGTDSLSSEVAGEGTKTQTESQWQSQYISKCQLCL